MQINLETLKWSDFDAFFFYMVQNFMLIPKIMSDLVYML